MGKMIMLKNVRVSFPQLWEEKPNENGGTFGRGCTLILNPQEHGPLINAVKSAMQKVAKEEPKFKGQIPPAHMRCLQSKETSTNFRDEYGEGSYILKCNTPKTPVVLHKDMTRATQENDPVYSGCRVNVKIDIWAQCNKFGKRINAKLLAIQFAGDDESFDGSYVSDDVAVEGFESLDDQAIDFDDIGESHSTPEDDDFM